MPTDMRLPGLDLHSLKGGREGGLADRLPTGHRVTFGWDEDGARTRAWRTIADDRDTHSMKRAHRAQILRERFAPTRSMSRKAAAALRSCGLPVRR